MMLYDLEKKKCNRVLPQFIHVNVNINFYFSGSKESCYFGQ